MWGVLVVKYNNIDPSDGAGPKRPAAGLGEGPRVGCTRCRRGPGPGRRRCRDKRGMIQRVSWRKRDRRPFNLHIVPVKHPVPDAGFYCAGVSWFSAALPDPQLVAAEVNAAPTAAAHRAALHFYNDLVNGRSITSDRGAVHAIYACPNGG